MTYIFDFDGTLVDSMVVFSAKMEEMFMEAGLPVAEDFVKIVTPLGYTGTAEYAISLGGRITVEEFIQGATRKMAPAYHHTIPAKAHVKQTLERLKMSGASLNVLTASPHAVLDKCLQRLGLLELFDNVWSCDDFNRTKSDPQIYVEAASRLGKTVAECIFVDDNIGAVSTAKKAGMYSVGIFDASSKDYIAEMRKAADRYIFDFQEL